MILDSLSRVISYEPEGVHSCDPLLIARISAGAKAKIRQMPLVKYKSN